MTQTIKRHPFHTLVSQEFTNNNMEFADQWIRAPLKLKKEIEKEQTKNGVL